MSDGILQLQSGQPAYFQLGAGSQPILPANRTFPRRFVLAPLTNFVTLQENRLSAVSVQTALTPSGDLSAAQS